MRTPLLWTLWTLLTLAGAAAVAAAVFIGGDRTGLMTGATTGVHHQFAASCDSCHGADPFSTTAKATKALNATCRGCHDGELKASDDSHPRKKFRDPRMADFWAKLDARACTSCHLEHKPGITRAGAVTLAADFCVACHSEGEQDVRVTRPSHAGLGFDSCAAAGCHNFHDNRALYENFLVKNHGGPWVDDAGVIEAAALMRSGARPAAEPEGPPLRAGDATAPDAAHDPAAVAAWAASAHAAGGVGCAACHAPGAEAQTLAAAWVGAPGPRACRACHRAETDTFLQGRHGMAGHPGIAKPRDPGKQIAALLKAAGLKGWEARIPQPVLDWLADAPPAPASPARTALAMKPDAAHETLGCGTCHDAHTVETAPARAQACIGCHDDRHSRAYEASPHAATLAAELAGAAAPGSGVGCADCHMPRIEARGGAHVTTHNQNEALRPNEKMIRPVCLSCHSLQFSLDALADADLVARNFAGQPVARIESIDWALKRATTRPAEP